MPASALGACAHPLVFRLLQQRLPFPPSLLWPGRSQGITDESPVGVVHVVERRQFVRGRFRQPFAALCRCLAVDGIGPSVHGSLLIHTRYWFHNPDTYNTTRTAASASCRTRRTSTRCRYPDYRPCQFPTTTPGTGRYQRWSGRVRPTAPRPSPRRWCRADVDCRECSR